MMLYAALHYIERGWPVLPLHSPLRKGCSCRRTWCKAVGKHPRIMNGLRDATTDRTRIERCWADWPDSNLGIVTGAQSGLVVLDVDDKKEGMGSSSLVAMSSEYGGLPPTQTAITGNGFHLFFRHPGFVIRSSRGALAKGIDVRAEGAYVVAVPSLHENGKRYRWANADEGIAVPPDWLFARLLSLK